jgi:hypothetical protein
MNSSKTSWYSRLWVLETIRRRVPYAYWLFYDAVVIYALLGRGGWMRVLAFVCVGVAVFFDVVEFIIKGSENKIIRRLFEGTGAPTIRPETFH